jgi:hypothetical protein
MDDTMCTITSSEARAQLTFNGSLSVADAGRDDVRTMFIGALGCNIARGHHRRSPCCR